MNKIYKRTYLNELPEIVILNLQRIIYDQQKGEKVKVHTQLSFPQSINFNDFIKNDNPTLYTEYNLKGVVIHTGTSEGGHYYSLVKTKKYGWLKFNDQNVTQFDEKDIER
jgi:ubiquitin C-terminal hydrolase